MGITVGVFGATGYTGIELTRALLAHPEAELTFLTSESSGGRRLRERWPQGPDLPLVPSEEARVDAVDCAFLCLPHGRSAALARRAIAAGARVIDLSADLRLGDAASYLRVYGLEHPAPELLPTPYGLPELGRERLAGARRIANPGCYATAVLLALAPLVRAGLLAPGAPLVVDAKSGATGAGRGAREHLMFCEVEGNCSPYQVGRAHRHVAEIEQVLAGAGLAPGRLVFTPHLLPAPRGILATAYVPTAAPEAVHPTLAAAYADEPFVDLLAPGELPTLAHVVGSPRAVLSAQPAGAGLPLALVFVALDNLLKGAATQAVQNLNLAFGLPETLGLVTEPAWSAA